MAQPVKRSDLERQDTEKYHCFGEHLDVNIPYIDSDIETDDSAVPPQSPAVPEMAKPVQRNDLELQDIEKNHPFGERVDVNLIQNDNNSDTEDIAVPPQSPAAPVNVHIDGDIETDDNGVNPQSPAVPDMPRPVHRNDLDDAEIENIDKFEEQGHQPSQQPLIDNNPSRTFQERVGRIFGNTWSALNSCVTPCMERLRRLDNTIEPEENPVWEMTRPIHRNDLAVEDIENIDQFVDPDNDHAPQLPRDNNPPRTYQEHVGSFLRGIWVACRTFLEHVGSFLSHIWASRKSICKYGLGLIIVVFCLILFAKGFAAVVYKDCFDVTEDPDRIRVARAKDCGVIKILDSGRLEEFPWMSRLVITGDSNSSCVGSIIHEQFVLTAASCCWNASLYPDKYQMVVRIGKYNSDSSPDCYRGGCAPKSTDLKIEKIIIQNGADKINYFCLVKLKTKIRLSEDDVYPICLPTNCKMQTKLFNDDQLSAVGWAEKSAGMKEPRIVPQKVSFHTEPINKCISKSDKNLICAFNSIGHRVCNEESGGPLMYEKAVTTWLILRDRIRHYVVGVINSGVNCSNPLHINATLMSTRVGPHLPWIFGNIIQNE